MYWTKCSLLQFVALVDYQMYFIYYWQTRIALITLKISIFLIWRLIMCTGKKNQDKWMKTEYFIKRKMLLRVATSFDSLPVSPSLLFKEQKRFMFLLSRIKNKIAPILYFFKNRGIIIIFSLVVQRFSTYKAIKCKPGWQWFDIEIL